MSLVISVQRSLPWAHACDEDRESSRSDASSNASIVAIVCSSNSRTAPRTVAAMGSSRTAENGGESAWPPRSHKDHPPPMSERCEDRSLLEREPNARGGQLELDATVRGGHLHHHAVLVLHDYRFAAAEHRPSRASGDVGAGEVLELPKGHHGALRGAPRKARFTERQSPDLDGVSPSQIGQCPRAPAESDPGGHRTLRQLQRGRGHPVLCCGRADYREQTSQHQRDQQLTHDHLLLLLGPPPRPL